MKKYILLFVVICIISCKQQPESGTLITVPVDVAEDNPVKLSEIADDITKISLELTDESIIGFVQKVIFQNDRLIVLDGSMDAKIMVFDSEGKFIRNISQKGQGPGEFVNINDITFVSKENNIYIATHENKILCFNIDGTFINECKVKYPEYINFREGYLNVFSTSLGEKVEGGYLNQTKLYKIDKECNIADSLIIKSIFSNHLQGAYYLQKHYISQTGKQTFVYYPVLTSEPIVRDTLYELRSNKLIPYLKLHFSDDGTVDSNNIKTKTLLNVWKSGMYIFANYSKKDQFLFIYNQKTGHGANMKDGIEDDIYNNGKILIAPLQDSYFYYQFSPETSDNNIEPNPDIYIGKLK